MISFGTFLTLCKVLDPEFDTSHIWDKGEKNKLKRYADDVAKEYGFTDWAAAYKQAAVIKVSDRIERDFVGSYVVDSNKGANGPIRAATLINVEGHSDPKIRVTFNNNAQIDYNLNETIYLKKP